MLVDTSSPCTKDAYHILEINNEFQEYQGMDSGSVFEIKHTSLEFEMPNKPPKH